jgi:hypothetical protein
MAPRNCISFEEIRDGTHFEDLVADYFNQLANTRATLPAIGGDGGRDILVDFAMADEIVPFTRRWVVQCKFRQETISNHHIAQHNLPTLIHSYSADGYLLICRRDVGQALALSFERLNDECKLGYSYVYWTGNAFKTRLRFVPSEPLLQVYFPDYYEFLQSIR